MRHWPPIFIFISKCETSHSFSVSKFGSVFFTLTKGTPLQSLLLRVLSLSFRFFSCSSVWSLLNLRDKLSLRFHRYSPTVSDQRMPVKLISILIRVQILRAQWYKYVAVYRKTENTIIVEPLIVWLFFQAVSHIAHKCQSFVNAIPQWQKQFLLSANVVPMHAN